MLFATLCRHLKEYKTSVSTDILRNLYVDNIITGQESEAALIEFYKDARSLMMAAKFNLRTWASNSQHLNNLTQQDKTADETNPTNILGINWNTSTDKLSLAPKRLIPADTTLVTKREILQKYLIQLVSQLLLPFVLNCSCKGSGKCRYIGMNQ